MVRDYAGVEMKTAVRNAVVDETIAGDPHASIEYLEPFANDRVVRPGILVCAPTRDFYSLIERQARQRRPFFPGTPPVADYDFLGEPFQGPVRVHDQRSALGEGRVGVGFGLCLSRSQSGGFGEAKSQGGYGGLLAAPYGKLLASFWLGCIGHSS